MPNFIAIYLRGAFPQICEILRFCDFFVVIIIIITVFIVRGLQDWPMAHYNCSYGVEMHVKNRENKIK